MFGFSKNRFEQPKDFDLWITDPKKIREIYQPHWEVKRDLDNFLGEKDNSSIYEIGAHLLQDEDDRFYLLLDEIRAGTLQHVNPDSLLDLLRKYQIEKIAGRFGKITKEGDNITEYGWENKILIDADLIGEKRENLQLLNIALKYKMTNTQFMRFRIRAKSAIDTVKKGEIKIGVLKNLEEIAKEVVGEDKY